MSIQDAVLLLANECKTNTSRFPKKRVSYLFSNHADIAAWLSTIPEETRQRAYESWKASKKTDPSRIRNSIRLFNLSLTVTEADLLLICNTVGKVRDIYRPRHRETGEPISSAFVDFESPIEMLTAIKELNGCTLNRQTICVDIPPTSFTANPSSQKKQALVASSS